MIPADNTGWIFVFTLPALGSPHSPPSSHRLERRLSRSLKLNRVHSRDQLSSEKEYRPRTHGRAPQARLVQFYEKALYGVLYGALDTCLTGLGRLPATRPKKEPRLAM